MRFWTFIFIFALAIGIGVLVQKDPGYALFSYGQWSIEAPLWLAALALVITISVILLGLWFLNALFSIPANIQHWWQRRLKLKARHKTTRGLLELAEERWKDSERHLVQGAAYSDTPLLNYIFAAQVAEAQNDIKKCDHYLQQAMKLAKQSKQSSGLILTALTQAECQLKQGEYEKALKFLKPFYAMMPKHPKLLRLLSKIYIQLKDWQALLELLPNLRKAKALSSKDYLALERMIYFYLLPIYTAKNLQALQALWKEIPRPLQKEPLILKEYLKCLIRLSEIETAEALLRYTLKKSFNDDLIHLYGFIEGHKKEKQLVFAESLLEDHPNNPFLYLTLGRLCLHNQLWGKARSYLEKSLSITPLPETYVELGQLMDKIGQPEKQEEYFKLALITAGKLPTSIIGTSNTYEQTLADNQTNSLPLCLLPENKLN